MQGALCQLQKSLIMAALVARCHLIRIRLVNVYQNCNTASNQDSSGTITTEFSLFGLNEKLNLYFAPIAKKKSAAIFLILVIRP